MKKEGSLFMFFNVFTMQIYLVVLGEEDSGHGRQLLLPVIAILHLGCLVCATELDLLGIPDGHAVELACVLAAGLLAELVLFDSRLLGRQGEVGKRDNFW